MAKELAKKPEAALPAHLQKAMANKQAAKEFSGGVQSGFPVLSYRGKTWRVKQGGEEQVYADEEGDAIQSINLVLVASNENLSKTYYKGKYKEGDTSKPNCWSATGIKPDPNVQNPVSSSCQGCPMNAWGSRVSEDGKKQKACADVRRMAVIMDHELEAVADGEKSIDDATVLLLRVPGGSLNPLKDYVEKKLLPKGGLLPYMLVTRLGFDTAAAHPKFAFKANRFLSEDEFSTVEELRESDIVKRIINEAAELEDGESTDEEGEAGTTAHAGKPEATESASPESSDEEEYSEEADDEDDDDDIAPPPPPKKAAKKRAAAVEEEAAEEEEEDDDDDIAPPPPPKKKTSKAKKAKESKPKSDEVESPDEDDDSVDDLLDRVLG